MRHGASSYLLPLFTLIAFVIVGHLLIGLGSKVDGLAVQIQTAETMVDPDETTMSTSWCWKGGEPPRHTNITVTTTRNVGESVPDFVARHSKRVDEQEVITPNNCPQHS